MKYKLYYIAGLLAFPGSALASTLLNGADSAHDPTTPTSLTAEFKVISNTLIGLVGAIAVIVIIFGGFRYVTSTGDAGRIKQAKDTILYGVIGIVVALLAYAIVRFVGTTFR